MLLVSQVWTRRELTEAQIGQACGAAQVRGDLLAGLMLLVDGLEIDCRRRADLPATVARELLAAEQRVEPYGWCYDFSAEALDFPAAVHQGLVKLAQAGDGVVAGENVLQWPETAEPQDYLALAQAARTTEPGLVLTWLVAGVDRPELRSDWERGLLAEPRYAQLPDRPQPQVVQLTAEGARPLWHVGLGLPLPFVDVDAVRDLFGQTARHLQPVLATCQYVPGIATVRGQVKISPEADVQPIGLYPVGLLGLPRWPAWLVWLGPAYLPLVRQNLVEEARTGQWQVDGYDVGALVQTSSTPTQTSRRWFARQLCARRSWVSKHLRPARLLPPL
ncbi:hypothetical protein EII12_01910 [Buchananella hordeovulneris]|uniref:hypothetical protein n=1 Tax=Buchananella hordeovulneris TaxID=52770 RepID=UPI000F5E0C0B|nr:hypothetical protein [Buchananella hordeovulneris]RRD53409.1 hypothetical protein EII12_01910 [Buchananella hordeovulneris]